MERNRGNKFNYRSNNRSRMGTSRNNDNGRSRDVADSNDVNVRRAKRPINYKDLEHMLKIECEAELILKLSSERSGFLLLLEQKDIRPDLMCLIFSALGRVSECSSELEIIQLLVHFYIKVIPKLNDNANFQRELVMYSANLRSHLAQPKRQNHINAVQNLLTFLRRLQLTLYQKSYDQIQYIVHQFASQIEYINGKGNVLNDRIVELLAELRQSMHNFEEMKAETEKQEVLLEPPENFRDIPIYPSTEDILYNHEPFIRKNVVEGKYVGGVDHYLDTQFRLLREDFVRPLRHGISEYVRLENKADAMKASKYRIKDLNVYRDVHIVGSKIVHNEQTHSLTFGIAPFRNLRWQVRIGLSILPNFLFLKFGILFLTRSKIYVYSLFSTIRE